MLSGRTSRTPQGYDNRESAQTVRTRPYGVIGEGISLAASVLHPVFKETDMKQPKEQKQQNPQAQPGQAGVQDTSARPQAGQDRDQPGASSDNRDEQRNQKQNQASQLSAADQQQSPKMNRGESAGGSGESLRHGALDAQYGTDSSKSGQGQKHSAGAEQSRPSGQSQSASNPGSSEKSTGSERDTMSGGREGGRS
jgi:hypothetical protein